MIFKDFKEEDYSPRNFELTLEQKKNAYIWAYQNCLKVPNGPYLCNVLIDFVMGSFRYNTSSFPGKGFLKLFPELYKQRPKDDEVDRPWWTYPYNENKHRLFALKQALRDVIRQMKEEDPIENVYNEEGLLLNKEQRLAAYRWVFDNFRKLPDGPLICNCLIDYIDKFHPEIVYLPGNILEQFPEFAKKEPPRNNLTPAFHGWWQKDEYGNKMREYTLFCVIQDLENELLLS